MVSRVTVDSIRRAVIAALADEPFVQAAFLFGSAARGTAGPLSDVDVGLLLDAQQSGDEPVCGRVMNRLCRTLAVPRVDVVSLDGAPMPLRYRVIRDGVLLSCTDAARLERFIVESVLHYLDFQPIRNLAFRVQRDAILADGR